MLPPGTPPPSMSVPSLFYLCYLSIPIFNAASNDYSSLLFSVCAKIICIRLSGLGIRSLRYCHSTTFFSCLAKLLATTLSAPNFPTLLRGPQFVTDPLRRLRIASRKVRLPRSEPCPGTQADDLLLAQTTIRGTADAGTMHNSSRRYAKYRRVISRGRRSRSRSREVCYGYGYGFTAIIYLKLGRSLHRQRHNPTDSEAAAPLPSASSFDDILCL
ncbi:hypothetical protein B0H11DRAFT_2056039 [Mycena galericulata]|nr:hypothetical protein B0H11DRAFT_2056039 [Mycena galericulata]